LEIDRLGKSDGYSPFDPKSVGAAKVNVKVPGYGWKDNKWWKTVEKVKAGDSIEVKNMRIAAELRKDAFPEFTRTKYRGNLSEAPDLTKTYDWHNPKKMIHPGPHQTPHVQMKLENGKWVRIEVKGK